jgi:hypothetical protein
MLQKNIDKQKRKERKTWVGLSPKREPTKKERIERKRKKYKNKRED